MAKIAEIVEIKTGYANYVNLVQEFNDPDENRGRMTQYMPIQSHRAAFDRLSHMLLPLDNRVYLLLGSYGTGKSHLCLMLANYLSRKTTEPEIQAFLANWEDSQVRSQGQIGVQAPPEASAETIRNRRGDGRYLVALAEYGAGDDFDTLVLRAVERACRREGFTGFLDTHYNEAIRRLERWQAREGAGGPSGAYRDFLDQLSQRHPSLTLDALKEDLGNFQQEALRIFKELYRAAVDADFTYHADNLVQILGDFLSNPAFKERYRGLVIIADEFGYILDRGQISMDVFGRFTEMCRVGAGGSLLAFVGTGHKVSLRAYAGKGLSEADINVVSDRVQDVALRPEGLEDIIAAVVLPQKSHPTWQAEIATRPGTFNTAVRDSAKAGIFSHLKGPVLRERIVENIYPMHPMATHCAIQLSTAVGSAARSLFTFFAGKPTALEEGSYPWYVARTDVATGGELNLYTADLLARYFQDELRPENTEARESLRVTIRNHRASLKQVEDAAAASLAPGVDELVRRLLDLMLVYQIAGVATTFENLRFGLHCQADAQESALRNRLEKLVADQTLFLNPTTRAYEFRLAGTGRDIEQMIETYVKDPENQPDDLPNSIVETEKLAKADLWLVASNHNSPYNEDKRLLRIFAQPGALEASYPAAGGQADYFSTLERQVLELTAWKDCYEGVAVYVLCESESDIQRAKRAAEGNKSPRVLVGIPNDPIPIREPLLRLRAALHLRETEKLDEWSLQERTRLDRDFIGDQEAGYRGEFLKARGRYLDGKALTWYTVDGAVLVAQPKTPYEPADLLMGQLYSDRNTKTVYDLNTIHVNKFGPGQNALLIDAVNALVRAGRPLEVDVSLGDNSGQKRYLQRALAEANVLVQTQKAAGSLIPYRVQTDSAKYATTYPALAALMERIKTLEPGKKVNVRTLIGELAGPPYGQGPIALSLFLAVAIRAFGDGLRFQLEPADWGSVTIQSADQVFELVNGKHLNAVVEYRAITTAERSLINVIYNLFSDQPGAAGQDHVVGDAYTALGGWWSARPNLARVADIYPASVSATAGPLVKLLARLADFPPHTFVLAELQTVYGLERDDAITDANLPALVAGLGGDKATIEGGPARVKAALLQRLMAPFAPESDLYGDYQKAIEAWYKELDANQRDRYAYKTNRQAAALLEHLPNIVNLETTFFQQLPKHLAFGLGAADDWNADRSDAYVTMFEGALAAIATNRIKVPEPLWKAQGIGAKITPAANGAEIRYRGGVKLRVEAPAAGVRVYLTDSGNDPTQNDVQRVEIKESWESTVNRRRDVKLVSCSADGAYGRVLTLALINEDMQYEPQPVAQQKLGEEEFKFIFPVDRAALMVTLRSLLTNAVERGLLDWAGARELLGELAEQSNNDPG